MLLMMHKSVSTERVIILIELIVESMWANVSLKICIQYFSYTSLAMEWCVLCAIVMVWKNKVSQCQLDPGS